MEPALRMPPHAYVPGRTPRHEEGAFDAIRRSVGSGASAGDLAGCAAFRHGLAYLDAGYFWEAHEVLEPVWMLLPQNSAERAFVQGLIQFANARLKARMDRPRAARRLCAIARDHLARAGGGDKDRIMGQRLSKFAAQIDSLERTLLDAL